MSIITEQTYCNKIYIKPKKSQIERFNFWFRKCTYLYNVGLEEKNEYYKYTGKYLNVYDQKKELVDIKDYDSSFKDVPNKALQEIIFRIDKSFKSFFKKESSYPKFKSYLNSIEFVKTDIRLIDGKLYLPKIKEHIKLSENIEQNYTSGRLVNENGKFYITLYYKKDYTVERENNDILGIDLGLKDLYTDSNNKKSKRLSIKLIKNYKRRTDNLNKSLSSKKKGSKKFKKVKKHLQKNYKRLRDTKNDYLHKVSTNLIKNSKESIIVVGDINVQSIIDKNKEVKTRKGLIKSFYVNSLGIFKQMISYKGVKFNKEVKFVNERNTSKTCSCCGNVKHDLKLNDRIYNCLKCNNKNIDRDFNSAINMKLLGSSLLSLSNDNCVLSNKQNNKITSE